ncbi:hypothetical protein C8P68_104368 [Mucilaginibacter yixingensis]|uniref:Activator of Hsp90 ATPase homologue 1/2-like C-terminal domain-containing protein n=1 Tax=Mucilaginibacter yixingensis TaxID=1295612 RepID=A0A2T5J9Y6_9SPHI|nr:SRPBCC domain-containing protein [Mucilaginibacter yixingensis]PTQ96875.1 hypothetical protein C8P68_104368 [Mucilaginibacter yixingensis]
MIADKRWTQFKITADLNIPVRAAYEAWTTSGGLESWFLREADFFTSAGRKRAPGEFVAKTDRYEWRWHGWPDDVKEHGQILEANGKDFIKFSFSGGSVVSVYINKRNDLTMIDLVQESIPFEKDPSKSLFVGCQNAWVFYLANLKSIYQGGIDLRNKEVDVMSSFK